MLDALLGPLWQYIAGAGAVIAALGLAWWRGRKGERDRRAAADAKAYQDTRREIDNADLGHGATDDERIKRLLDIANRGGSGKT
jgi:hypothetical protein